MYAASDPALSPVGVHTGLSGKYADENRLWQGIPAVERTKNGRLFAAFYSGGATEGPDNFVLLYCSDEYRCNTNSDIHRCGGDDARSFRPLLALDSPAPVRAFDPALWIDPRGRLWLFWAQGRGEDEGGRPIVYDGRHGVFCMVCGDPDAPLGPGQHLVFGPPRRIANGIMMNKPTVRADGAWLLPCAVWNFPGPRLFDLPEERFSNVYISTDEGVSFSLLGHADYPERHIDEHMILERRDGSLWMLIRAGGGEAVYAPEEVPGGGLRLRARGGIGEAFSQDGGRTWTDARDAGLGGPGSRFFLRRLRSGRILLVNHYRYAGRSRLTALLSEDEGVSWKGFLPLDEREGVSYPDGAEGEDGRIYIIYDRGRYREREILLAAVTEAHILAGRVTDPGSRLRILVNRAGAPPPRGGETAPGA